MENMIKENPNATTDSNSVRKVVIVKVEEYPVANSLIKKGWELLKITEF